MTARSTTIRTHRLCLRERWANAVIGKFYRPLKTPVTMRIDNDVLAWLKSKGEGHLTRINEILREKMMAELSPPRASKR